MAAGAAAAAAAAAGAAATGTDSPVPAAGRGGAASGLKRASNLSLRVVRLFAGAIFVVVVFVWLVVGSFGGVLSS
jgi:hypothetical protein